MQLYNINKNFEWTNFFLVVYLKCAIIKITWNKFFFNFWFAEINSYFLVMKLTDAVGNVCVREQMQIMVWIQQIISVWCPYQLVRRINFDQRLALFVFEYLILIKNDVAIVSDCCCFFFLNVCLFSRLVYIKTNSFTLSAALNFSSFGITYNKKYPKCCLEIAVKNISGNTYSVTVLKYLWIINTKKLFQIVHFKDS